MIDKELVIKLAEERMKELDSSLYIVELNINSGNQIHLEIDRAQGSVSIDDCVAVSRNIEHNLNRDIEDFSLEVSSAGIDKPFRVQKQYLKNIGNEVKVTPVEHGKTVTGVLKTVSDVGITVEVTEKEQVEGKKKKVWVTKEIDLPFEEIKETKLVITF